MQSEALAEASLFRKARSSGPQREIQTFRQPQFAPDHPAFLLAPIASALKTSWRHGLRVKVAHTEMEVGQQAGSKAVRQ